MKIDTAGNKIKEIIPNCNCGLTGGCEKCNPILRENYDWGEQKKKELKEWKEKFDKDLEERRLKFWGKKE